MHWHSTCEHVVDGELGQQACGNTLHHEPQVVGMQTAWQPTPLRLCLLPASCPPSARRSPPSTTAAPSGSPPGNVCALELHIVTAVDNTTDVKVPQACNEKLCLAVFGIKQEVRLC